MTNAAFFTHSYYFLPERLPQFPGPKPDQLMAQGLLKQETRCEDQTVQCYAKSGSLCLLRW